MKNKLLNRWGIVITFVILLIGIFLIIKVNNSVSIKEAQDSYHRPGMAEGSNTIQVGLLDSEGKLIDGGSQLSVKDSKVSYTVSFDSFIPEEREYMLIILADFEQIPFYINGKQMVTYTFKTEVNGSVNIPTSVEVDTKTKEISYLIVKKPYDLFKPKTINNSVIEKASSLEQAISLRFSLENKSPEINHSDNYQQVEGGTLIETFLSKDPKELKPVFEQKSKGKLHLTVGNTLSQDMDIAIVQFLDWEQLPFNEGEKVQYVNAPAKKAYSKEIELPVVSKESNFQVFIFYKPYSISPTDYDGLLTFGTYRLVVTP